MCMFNVNMFVSVGSCPPDFERVEDSCVFWLGRRAKYHEAAKLCAQKNPLASTLMMKTEKLSNAIFAWDKVNRK